MGLVLVYLSGEFEPCQLGKRRVHGKLDALLRSVNTNSFLLVFETRVFLSLEVSS